MTVRGLLVRLAVVIGASNQAAAGPCDDVLHDPVPLAGQGFLLSGRSACVRSALSARLSAAAIVDVDNYYGYIVGQQDLVGQFEVTPKVEVGFGLRLLDAKFAQNAVIQALELAYGPFFVSGLKTWRPHRQVSLGVNVVAMVPYTHSDLNAVRASGQSQGLATATFGQRWAAHARIALQGGFLTSAGGSDLRGAMSGSLDVSGMALHWLDISVGAEQTIGWGRASMTLIRGGAHWRVIDRWRVDAGLGLPVRGDARTNAMLTIGVHRDWAR